MARRADLTDLAHQWAMLAESLLQRGNPAYRAVLKPFLPRLDNSLSTLNGVRLFVVVSTGRTGTTWLANLLDTCPSARVVHEPVPWEQYEMARAMWDPSRAHAYLTSFRVREMALRVTAARPAIYGEVNPAIRHHVDALRALFGHITVIHLVRDARTFVPSVMARERFTGADRVLGERPPTPQIADAWKTMTRFEKVCWMWAHENDYLAQRADGLARFEAITDSYRSFSQQLLAPLNLTISEQAWRQRAARSLNPTRPAAARPAPDTCWVATAPAVS